jgi:hypothetical protein
MVGLQIDEEKSFYCTGKQFHCLGYTIDQYMDLNYLKAHWFGE